MNKYRIATKTDSLRYRIAKEVFGEIEDDDGVRDIPSWEIFEKTLEQHKQILSLQYQLAEKDEQIKRSVTVYKKQFIEQTDEIYKLTQQLEQLEKGKELDNSFWKQECDSLQKTLAEKEKEIEELKMYKKGAYEKYVHKCEYLQGQIKDLYKNQNQKAIEQLEKIINLFEPYENENKDTILCANNGISFLEYIDQQISLLKGE